MRKIGNIRTFETKHFKVVVDAEEEQDLDLSFDDDGTVRKGLDSGKFIAFCAHAYVIFKPTGERLADDYLGNCIYESIEAFMNHKECGRQNREYEVKGETGRCGSYFSDMVGNVCDEARKTYNAMREYVAQIKLRE